MPTIKNYDSRIPLLLYGLADLTFPIALFLLLQTLLTTNPWGEVHIWFGLITGASMVAAILLLNGYSRRNERSIAQNLQLVVTAWILILFIMIFLAYLNVVIQDLSRTVIIMWGVLTPISLLIVRILISKTYYVIKPNSTHVLFLKPYAFTLFEKKRLTNQSIDIVFLNPQEDLSLTITKYNPDFIVLNTEEAPTTEIINRLTETEKKGTQLIRLDKFMEAFLRKCYVDYESIDLGFLQEVTPYSRLNYLLKRLIDISAALILAILSAPIMLYAVWKIRQESPGLVIFSQERVGINGRVFMLYKFRSMHLDAEKDGAKFAQLHDPRTYAFGAFMRKSRIDELPQLWNVIKGDIHFIGPRPERKIFTDDLEKEIPFYNERHLVAPGISGWAQVMYPYGSCTEDARQKLMYDLYYIKNWSIWLEIETLIRTVGVVIGKKGL